MDIDWDFFCIFFVFSILIICRFFVVHLPKINVFEIEHWGRCTKEPMNKKNFETLYMCQRNGWCVDCSMALHFLRVKKRKIKSTERTDNSSAKVLCSLKSWKFISKTNYDQCTVYGIGETTTLQYRLHINIIKQSTIVGRHRFVFFFFSWIPFCSSKRGIQSKEAASKKGKKKPFHQSDFGMLPFCLLFHVFVWVVDECSYC